MKEKIKIKIDSWTRPSRKWTDIFIISYLFSLALLFCGYYVTYFIFKPIPFDKVFGIVTTSDSILEFLSLYVEFLGIWIVFVLFCAIYKSNRPILKQLAPNKNGNNFKGIVIGLLLGFGLNGICIFISLLTGKIHLSFNSFNPALFFVFLF